MRIPFAANFLCLGLFGLFLTLATPALGEGHVLMQNAIDLVHQAWNPGGDPPPNDQRVKLLKRALSLLNNDPFQGYEGYRVKAIRHIKAALYEIKNGDPDNKVDDYLQDAIDEMKSAIINAD